MSLGQNDVQEIIGGWHRRNRRLQRRRHEAKSMMPLEVLRLILACCRKKIVVRLSNHFFSLTAWTYGFCAHDFLKPSVDMIGLSLISWRVVGWFVQGTAKMPTAEQQRSCKPQRNKSTALTARIVVSK